MAWRSCPLATFFDSMENPADVAPMLHEMATIGGAMAVTVTIVWLIIVLIAELKAKAMPEVKAKPVSGGG